jgi:hypothetical protein
MKSLLQLRQRKQSVDIILRKEFIDKTLIILFMDTILKTDVDESALHALANDTNESMDKKECLDAYQRRFGSGFRLTIFILDRPFLVESRLTSMLSRFLSFGVSLVLSFVAFLKPFPLEISLRLDILVYVTIYFLCWFSWYRMYNGFGAFFQTDYTYICILFSSGFVCHRKLLYIIVSNIKFY